MNKEETERLKELARQQKAANKKFLSRLKRQKKSLKLDDIFHELHHEAFKKIDCLECANCCKSISPIIWDKDIQRIANYLKMKPSEFTSTYLKIDEEGDFVFRQTPCPFLLPDNYCSIYGIRPRSCREYPHTDRRNIHQILDLTLKNTFICPAVYEIIESLKKRLPLSIKK
jgi:hypothetical protein